MLILGTKKRSTSVDLSYVIKAAKEIAKSSKKKKTNCDVMSEDEYDSYMMAQYDMSFIAGYTEGGIPYGTSIFEDEDIETVESCSEDDIPFKGGKNDKTYRIKISL